MSDEEPKVLSLDKERQRRLDKEGLELYSKGEAFKFDVFEFIDDEDAPNGVVVMGGDYPIGILVSIEGLTGICMSMDTARRLYKELEGVVQEQEVQKEGA